MARGDHVLVRRLGYWHHGVVVDDENVIHFNGEPGSKAGATIRRSSLVDFMNGGKLTARMYGDPFSPDEAIARAESKLGESGYNLFSNNCEHFARWCVSGKHSSVQVNSAAASGGALAVTGAAAIGGIGAVSAAGSVPGLSAAGIFSGLAAIGPAGVIGGLVTVGVLPGTISALIMQVALKDDATLTGGERSARRLGRTASLAGAGGAAVGGVAAVSAAGSVAGLSAAGISSGLAAIGGSMAVGTGMVVAAPAIAAAGIGFGAYRIARSISTRRASRKDLRSDAPVSGQFDAMEIARSRDDSEILRVDIALIEHWCLQLTAGPAERVTELPTSAGDSAGVYTIWYRDALVAFGYARDSRESRPTNRKQADGVRGRVKGVVRQPGRRLQAELRAKFSDDWSDIAETTDARRAAALLRAGGTCRMLHFESGEAAKAARNTLESRLSAIVHQDAIVE